jgi:hypothetical protein
MVKHRPPGLDLAELRQALPQPLDRHTWRLGVALLMPPIAWSVHFALSYGLVYPALDSNSKTALHVVSLGSAILSAAGVMLGWSSLRSPPGAPSAERERSRFLALCACALGTFFFVATLAQAVPAFMQSLSGRP